MASDKHTATWNIRSSSANALLDETGRQRLLQHCDFFALRHGQSQANVAGIICSDPAVACQTYGLSDPVGRAQAAAAGRTIAQLYLQQQLLPDNNNNRKYSGLWIVTSDLLRAKETAEIVYQTVLEAVEASAAAASLSPSSVSLTTDVRLRERGFGAWDGGSDANYERVWQADRLDSAHTEHGVESVDSVTRRATQCVVEWNAKATVTATTATTAACTSTGTNAKNNDGNGNDDDDGKQNNRRMMIVLTAHGDVLQILQTAFCKLPGTQHRSIEHLETATVRALELKM